MAPPSTLVSISTTSSAHLEIVRAGALCLNLLSVDQHLPVQLFSSSATRDRRFAYDIWEEHCGLPGLRAAAASIACRVQHRAQFVTHELFVGEVTGVMLNDAAEPLAWVEGGLARIVAFRPGE